MDDDEMTTGATTTTTTTTTIPMDISSSLSNVDENEGANAATMTEANVVAVSSEVTSTVANDNAAAAAAASVYNNNKKKTPTMADSTSSSSSSPTTTMMTASASSSCSSSVVVFTPELLRVYYSRLFPFALMYQWLSYDPKLLLTPPPTVTTAASNRSDKNNKNKTFSTSSSLLFQRREFSFTLQTAMQEEIYLRYQSFKTMEEWQQAMINKNPIKMDLGAMYSHAPFDKNSLMTNTNTSFQPMQRELVIDIDVSDYDDIRHCGCHGASQLCRICWTYLDMSQAVLDVTLRQDFGFDHIAWFYSGRRGMHAWICDARARTLSNPARSALANYLQVELLNLTSGGGGGGHNKVSSPLQHPMITRSRDILEPYFCQYVLPAKLQNSNKLIGHGLLATPERWTKDVLDTLPFAAQWVKDKLLEKWGDGGTTTTTTTTTSTPQEKWEELLKYLKVCHDKLQEDARTTPKSKKSKTNNNPTTTISESDIMAVEMWSTQCILKHTYPRIDINVTKMQNHLLKSPFCVHPKTGRICVYIPKSYYHNNNTNDHMDDDENHHNSNNNNNIKNKTMKKNKIDTTTTTKKKKFDPFSVPTLAQVIQELEDYHHQSQQEESSTEPQQDAISNNSNNTKTIIKYDWQKTSLRPYLEAFEMEFVQPMLHELRVKSRQEQEVEDAVRGNF